MWTKKHGECLILKEKACYSKGYVAINPPQKCPPLNTYPIILGTF